MSKIYSRCMISKISRLAIVIGLSALFVTYAVSYTAYIKSVTNAEKKQHIHYTEKAQLLHAVIRAREHQSDAAILKAIEEVFAGSATHPEDEYICIVDRHSNLILHTKYPELIGTYAGSNNIIIKGKPLFTVSDLVTNQHSYTGNYISSSGEKQIAAFEYIPSHQWVLGVHRSKEAIGKEVRSHYQYLLIIFILVTGILTPLSILILYRVSEKNHRRRIEVETDSKIKLLEAKEKAEKSDAMKSAFLANLSHEIRTPMNGVIGFAKLLKKKDLVEKKRQDYANIVLKSSERIMNILGDLIHMSKIEAGQVSLDPKPFNLNKLMDETCLFFSQEAERKKLIFSCSKSMKDTEAMVVADKTKIEQILYNLLKNAFKFTCEGAINFGYTVADGHIRFSVEDTGRGIPAEMQESVFERFKKVGESPVAEEDGSGLGLAISKSFTDLMNGRIWVESEPGSGSTFYFSIPYVSMDSEV